MTLSKEHKHECDMALALLKEQRLAKEVLKARIKMLDKIRIDENGDSTPDHKAIAAYLVAGIKTEIPEPLRLRAHHILFARDGDDEDDQLGKTGVLYTYADALNTPTNTEWIVDGLLSPGSVSLICGEGGSKKTYAMIDLVVAVSRGSDWLNFGVPMPTTTLFVDEESGPRRFSQRLCKTGQAHEATSDLPLFYISLAGFELTTTDGQDKLHKLITETGAKLVVLDALVDVMSGGDENAVSDVQPIFVGLRRIAEMTHSAIVVIHHTNRAGEYRGSSALKGAVDLLLLVISPDKEQVVKFKTEKARDIEPVTFYALANFGDGTFNLSPITGTKRAERLHPIILGWLQEEDLNQSELVKRAKDQGTGRNSVLSALAEMVETGTIAVEVKSRGTKVYSSVV